MPSQGEIQYKEYQKYVPYLETYITTGEECMTVLPLWGIQEEDSKSSLNLQVLEYHHPIYC